MLNRPDSSSESNPFLDLGGESARRRVPAMARLLLVSGCVNWSLRFGRTQRTKLSSKATNNEPSPTLPAGAPPGPQISLEPSTGKAHCCARQVVTPTERSPTMTLALALSSYSQGLLTAAETKRNRASNRDPFTSPKPHHSRPGGAAPWRLMEHESPRGSDEELFAESLFENWTVRFKQQTIGNSSSCKLERGPFSNHHQPIVMGFLSRYLSQKSQQSRHHREEALRLPDPKKTFSKHESDARTSGVTSGWRPFKSEPEGAVKKADCDVSLANLGHTLRTRAETCNLNENLLVIRESLRCASTNRICHQNDTGTATRVSATAHFPARKPSNAFSTVINHGNSCVKHQQPLGSNNNTTTMAHPRDPSASPSASTDPWMKGSPSKRSRSRAIPIKRQTSSNHLTANTASQDHPEEEASWSHGDAEVERMYDWATWRLYHRIVEHREKYPLTASYFESSSSSTAPGGSSSDSRKGSHPSLRGVGDGSSRDASSVHFDHSPLEGEVFELDL